MQESSAADRTAVIVVDMLNDFVTGPLKCERAQRIIPHLQDLLKAAREKGVYVIYTCDAHIRGIDHELELWGDHALAGTEGAEIIPELAPTERDFVIHKRRYSGFCGTGLDILLRELHVGTVIITGMQAHICVQHTAADAFYLGYRIIVPTDGIEAFTGEILECEYGYLKEMYGAELALVDDIVKRFRRPPRGRKSSFYTRRALPDAMGMHLDAVGFDMDGTFMRTHVDYPKLADADRIVLEGHRIPFDEIDFHGQKKRLRGPIRDWMEAHGRADEWPQVYREIDELTLEIELEHADEAEPFPGAVEALHKIQGMGFHTGILTRGGLEYARRTLGPLFDEFDVVQGRDYTFYDEAKPSPVAMRQFAGALGTEPEHVLYVGDNLTDWMSARDAGARFVGVLTGTCTREDWEKADPDMTVVDSVADIPGLL